MHCLADVAQSLVGVRWSIKYIYRWSMSVGDMGWPSVTRWSRNALYEVVLLQYLPWQVEVHPQTPPRLQREQRDKLEWTLYSVVIVKQPADTLYCELVQLLTVGLYHIIASGRGSNAWPKVIARHTPRSSVGIPCVEKCSNIQACDNNSELDSYNL